MADWQPIDTHDKGTADFLASIPSGEMEDKRTTICAWGRDLNGFVYIDLVTDDPCFPTHWMPLPEPVDG